MSTAIIYYSHTRNNLMLAEDLRRATGGTLIRIEETKKRTSSTIFLDILFHRTPRIKEYLHLDGRFDHYILVAPIWGGKIASPLRSFIIKEASKIRSYSFISICGGGKDQRGDIEKELTGLVNQKPVAVAQLSLTDLCKDHHADLVKYQIDKDDLEYFSDQINDFVTTVTRAVVPVVTV